MQESRLYEPFDLPEFHARLQWYHAPKTWSIQKSCLKMKPESKTDYWQKTHYGFAADNGHFLFTEVSGNMTMTTHVRFHPIHQYDQAGLMVRISPSCWLKTSVEFEPNEPNRLGVVVTNHGYSDWSTQNIADTCHELFFRVRREHNDYFVEYAPVNANSDENEWIQIRMAHLHEDSGDMPVQSGIYACSPIESGFSADFEFLMIE